MAEIKVGTIIKCQAKQGTLRGVITRLDSENESCNILWEDGYTSFMYIKRIIDGLLTDGTYDIENTLNAIKGKDTKPKPEIEVGVIVEGKFCDGVVTKIDNMYGDAFVLWSDGETSTETFEWVNRHLTGRKIKGLDEVLDEINDVNED